MIEGSRSFATFGRDLRHEQPGDALLDRRWSETESQGTSIQRQSGLGSLEARLLSRNAASGVTIRKGKSLHDTTNQVPRPRPAFPREFRG